MDSAFYGRGPVHAAIAGGAAVSVTVRMDKAVKAAITTIPDEVWTTIEYTDAILDPATGRWISRAEVAEIPFTAFSAQKKSERVPGRLVVRRIPDFSAEAHKAAGQDTLFDVWRFHAFFTTADTAVLDTVAADKTHRQHAVIEQVHSDLKNSALAHLPSGGVHRERGLARARGHRVQPHSRGRCRRGARPRQGDDRDHPAHVGQRPSPRGELGPPDHPASTSSVAMGDRLDRPLRASQRPAASPCGLNTQQPPAARPEEHMDDPDTKVRQTGTPPTTHPFASRLMPRSPRTSVDRGLGAPLT